jgi:hypothetical protein
MLPLSSCSSCLLHNMLLLAVPTANIVLKAAAAGVALPHQAAIMALNVTGGSVFRQLFPLLLFQPLRLPHQLPLQPMKRRLFSITLRPVVPTLEISWLVQPKALLMLGALWVKKPI